MTRAQKVVAVVGIDGCGKSTVIKRFAALSAEEKGAVVSMTCPGYHLTPNAPFPLLSRQLDALSRSGDALGSHAIKATGMYLQMSLYGPTERFFLSAFEPELLLTEHHALVDSLAYSPLYVRMLGKPIDRGVHEATLRQRLDAVAPGSLADVVAWHQAEQRRLGHSVDFFHLPEQLGEVFRQEREPLLADLGRRYRTKLPDTLLFLDVPVAVALERLARREAAEAELHEQPAVLEALRQCFLGLVTWLRQAHPEVDVQVIDTSDARSVDATLAEVMERSHLRPAGATR